MSETIQCPCGRTIEDYTDYELLYLKKDEIDILCQNEYCYLRELGFLKIDIDTDTSNISFQAGKFYAPYVTWNATRMSEEKTVEILRQHLIDITEKLVEWDKIKISAKKRTE
jgi:hypothetical protein